MSLNCFSARSTIETNSELEAASKLVERTFGRILKTDIKRERVRQAIKDVRASKTHERESHVEWLKQRKSLLVKELVALDQQLEEKKMRLHERTQTCYGKDG
ncbi:hypothetical protein CCR75_008165 [Bremia lactucae]|uniref:Uncharacterized protein n=1 Tax=Bremia lactucae TaxID=4779 RepID=A0A976IDK9_BRELC|nr:hypothetical protein CCR75_008165 [Bremia lactucae]